MSGVAAIAYPTLLFTPRDRKIVDLASAYSYTTQVKCEFLSHTAQHHRFVSFRPVVPHVGRGNHSTCSATQRWLKNHPDVFPYRRASIGCGSHSVEQDC